MRPPGAGCPEGGRAGPRGTMRLGRSARRSTPTGAVAPGSTCATAPGWKIESTSGLRRLEQRLLVATGSGFRRHIAIGCRSKLVHCGAAGVREARCRAFTVPRGTTTPTPRLVLSAVDIGRMRDPLSTGAVLARHQNDQPNTFIVSLRLHHGQGAAILRRSGSRRRASGRNVEAGPTSGQDGTQHRPCHDPTGVMVDEISRLTDRTELVYRRQLSQ